MAKKPKSVVLNPSPFARPRANVGSLLDIPAGRYHKGIHGDNILSGSHSNFIGVGGRGNTFKTTLLLSLMIRILSRYEGTTLSVYDTEITFDWNRLFDIASTYPNLDYMDLVDTQRMLVTSADIHSGNEWWSIIRARSDERAASFKRSSVETPFIDMRGDFIRALPLEQHLLDSLSQFSTDAIEDIYDSSEVDAGEATTDALRSGGIKTRLIMQVPRVTAAGNMCIAATAHVGNEFKLGKYDPSTQQLAAMPKSLKFKNVPEKFTFLTHNTWYIRSAVPCQHDTTKASMYPLDGQNSLAGDVDLMELTITNVRNKSGPTNHTFTLLVSQDFGLMPGLSEYNYLHKRKDKFGLAGPEGQQKSYRLELYDAPLLARTKLRQMIADDYKLQRALEITSEMCQIYDYWKDFPAILIMTPKELRDRLIARGYDMDLLLNTRGYWTYDHYNPKHIPPLTTQDILEAAMGIYVPWWYPNKESIKKDAPTETTTVA